MMLPPVRIAPYTRGITAPSVEAVICRVSSRWPAIRCVGAIEATSQESTAAPAIEPTAPPIAAAETPRIEPPTDPPIAVPAAARMIEAMG